MTTETEALRAQFEREIGEAAPFPVQRYGDSYAHRICAWAWEGYQAGHAAAKAGTAAVGARGISLARELRDQADFDEAESVFGGGSRTRELMREAADALHAGAEERGE